MKNISIGLIALAGLVAPLQAQENLIEIEAIMDNSIYEEGELSNGAGEYIFTGKIRTGERRRALVKFDPASAIPEGAVVDSAVFILQTSRMRKASVDITLHRVTTAWGEGTSDAEGAEGQGITATEGDATWTSAKFGDDLWIKAGGDYEAQASATTTVVNGAVTEFTSAAMADDINLWIETPSANHGWMVIGDETENETAVRFLSRENEELAQRPTLVLFFGEATFTDERSLTNKPFHVYYAGQGFLAVESREEVSGEAGILELYSASGQKLITRQLRFSTGSGTVETGQTNAGIYLYRIRSGEHAMSGRIYLPGQ